MAGASWIIPAYSRTRVDKAARVLIRPDASTADVIEALDVFSNWRAAHGYPLNTAQIVLRSRARRLALNGLISQRHKREISIIRKLERTRSMRLTQMQDIAGCRAVLSSIGQVALLRSYYESDIRDDYITEPASSGYRSVHAVSQYQGKTKTEFDGLLVETQIRTALQHAWATAVETVDTFTGSDLKSGYGDPMWRRLFALISSAFALREKCACVPSTPSDPQLIRSELRDLERELGLVARLQTWHRTAQVVRDPSFRFKKYLLIEQWPSTGEIRLHTFSPGQFEEATRKYVELEQQVTAENRLQVVMASAESLPALKRAYPNLFVDPSAFLRAYERAMA